MVKHRHWESEHEWRAIMGGEEPKHYDLAHAISVCLGPWCSTSDMERVRDALPRTAKDFEIVFPVMNDGRPEFATYDVSAVIDHYGEIPRLDKLFSDGGTDPGLPSVDPTIEKADA